MRNRLLDLCWPRVCPLCQSNSRTPVCDHCHGELPGRFRPRCLQCAIDLGVDVTTRRHRIERAGPQHDVRRESVCARCMRDPPAFSRTVVASDYDAPLDATIRSLKSAARLGLATGLGWLVAQAILETPELLGSAGEWLVVPVPIGRRRLAQRGFNPAAEIARHAIPPLRRAFRPIRIQLDEGALTRCRDSPPQASLSRRERLDNVRDAFAAAPRVAGRPVILVDDAMTTGATAGACALALRASGAVEVIVAAVARTTDDHFRQHRRVGGVSSAPTAVPFTSG